MKILNLHCARKQVSDCAVLLGAKCQRWSTPYQPLALHVGTDQPVCSMSAPYATVREPLSQALQRHICMLFPGNSAAEAFMQVSDHILECDGPYYTEQLWTARDHALTLQDVIDVPRCVSCRILGGRGVQS